MSTPESPAPPLSIRLSALLEYMLRPGELQGVSFWPRVAARIVDLITHYFVSSASGFLFWTNARVCRQWSSLTPRAYEAICEGVYGSTLGKLLLPMTVVQEDGTPCRFGPAIIRSVAYLVDSLFLGLVGHNAMQDDERHQRFGDQWAHTVVCKRADVAPEHRRDVVRFIAGLLFGFMVGSPGTELEFAL